MLKQLQLIDLDPHDPHFSAFTNTSFESNRKLKFMPVDTPIMEPTIPRNSIAILKEIPPEKMQEGVVYCVVENTTIPTLQSPETPVKWSTFGRRQVKTKKGVWLIFDNKQFKKKFIRFEDISEVYLVVGYFKELYPFYNLFKF